MDRGLHWVTLFIALRWPQAARTFQSASYKLLLVSKWSCWPKKLNYANIKMLQPIRRWHTAKRVSIKVACKQLWWITPIFVAGSKQYAFLFHLTELPRKSKVDFHYFRKGFIIPYRKIRHQSFIETWWTVSSVFHKPPNMPRIRLNRLESDPFIY